MSTYLKNRDLPLIAGMALGSMLNPLNTSMIAVALNRLQSAFHLTYFELSWIISSYYLASAIAQPVLGKLGDQIGRRRVFFLGLGLITVSSSCAPFSPTFGWLLLFRIIQAVGTSSIMPNSVGIVRTSVSGSQVKALATMSVITSISAAFGPFIGGLLLQWYDWPSLFLINFPFLVAAFLLAWRYAPPDGKLNAADFRIDIFGVILFAVTISALLIFFISLRIHLNWMWLATALSAGIGLYYWENSIKSPFVDVPFLKRHIPVCLLYAQNLLANIVFYSVLFGIPLFLQQVRHATPLNTGLIMLPLAGFGLIITPFLGRWVHARGSRGALFAGAICTLLGLLFLLAIEEETSLIWLLSVLAVLGIGNAMSGFALQMSLYEHIKPAETGIATGLFMTARFTGTIFCASLLSICFGANITSREFHSLALACALIVSVIIGIMIRMFRASGAA